MNSDELLKALDESHGGVPDDLLNTAVDQKNAITPKLIAAIEEVVAQPDLFLETPERNLFYWAAYLLAHFEEPKALAPMVNLIKLGAGKYEPLVEDLFEDAPLLMANTAKGNVAPIIELLQNGSGIPRECAVDALGLLCSWGEIDAAVVEAEYLRTLESLAKSDAALGAVIANASIDLNLRELGPAIQQAYDRGAIDRDLADFELFGEWLHDPDFPSPPPFLFLRQEIGDIVEFFHEKLKEDRMADGFFSPDWN